MKPWETKEWKEMRERRIGDRCEQCESTDGPFVIQHFSHERPSLPSKDGFVWELMREYDQVPTRPTVQRPACTQCNRRALSERKKLRPKWRCIGCHHEFDEPIVVEVTIDNRTEKDTWVRWKREVLFPARDDFLVTHQDVVEQRYGAALADYEKKRQASYDHYISGDGTATFCRKCAYLWDEHGKRLCSHCKTDYHLFKYKTCYNCLPTSKKEESVRRREFEAEMDARMKSLEEAYDLDSPTSA